MDTDFGDIQLLQGFSRKCRHNDIVEDLELDGEYAESNNDDRGKWLHYYAKRLHKLFL